MVEEVRLLKIEVSPLQLAEWLIHGIAVIISLLQVDSVNDRTRWPIPRASPTWERIGNIQGRDINFLCVDFIAALKPYSFLKFSLTAVPYSMQEQISVW